MYGYGYRYNSGLVIGAGGGAPFANISSLSFDGVDDYVISSLDGTSTGGVLPATDSDINLTISLWFKRNDDAPSGVFQWANSLSDGTPFFLIQSLLNSYRILIDGGWKSGSVVSVGDWINFIVTRDSLTNIWTGYHNGLVVFTYDDGGTSLSNRSSASSIYLGNGYGNGFLGYFNGSIDEVCLLDRIATPTEIVTLSTAPTVSLTDLNPIAWYRNGDNGAWKSPQWLIPNNENFAANKVSNYSMDFDGVDDGLSISEVVYSDAFTFSFWAKPTTLSLAFICGDINSNGNFIWLFSATRVMLKINAVAYTFIESGGNDIVIGDWQNIVITRDSSNNINCYRNGVSFGSSSNLGGNFEFNSIGEVHRAIGNWHFNGGLDEFAVWDNDQSANIATIYNSGEPTTLPSGASLHYKMGEDSTFSGGVWTVPDSVGSNPGTSANMTIEDRIGEAPNSTSNAVSFNMDEVDRTTDVPT